MYYQFFRILDKSLNSSLGEINRMLAKEQNPELERLKENIENSMEIMNNIKRNNKTNAELIKEISDNNLLNENFRVSNINETYFGMETNFDFGARKWAETSKIFQNVLLNLFEEFSKIYRDSFKVKKITRNFRNPRSGINLRVSISKKIDQESFLSKYNNLIFIINEINEKFNDLLDFVQKVIHIKNCINHTVSRLEMSKIQNSNIEVTLNDNNFIIASPNYMFKLKTRSLYGQFRKDRIIVFLENLSKIDKPISIDYISVSESKEDL